HPAAVRHPRALRTIHRRRRAASSLTFADAAVQVGEPLVAVGRLPKEIGFQTYVLSNRVSAVLRGPLPSVLTVGDGLATVGSVVANTDGEVVGYVFEQENVSPMSAMMNTGPGASLQVITAVPPRLFVPADYLRLSLESPPSPGEPVSIPETGLRQLRGLSEDLREFYELGNMPAIEVGDIIPGSAAEQAGLQTGEIIVALNGEQLERGDTPEELPQIFYRTVRRQAVGSTLSMTILNPAGEKRDIELTLAERATQTNAASREYDETLGFSVRDVMFDDTYFRKIDPDTVGAIVEYIEETSAAATARLARGDLVRKLNQTDITGPQQFMEELAKFRESDPQGDVVLEVLRRDDTQIIRIEPPQ
ncbi:MAG: PDZ domain-containing protein, partial [Planctomycetota bacterium]